MHAFSTDLKRRSQKSQQNHSTRKRSNSSIDDPGTLKTITSDSVTEFHQYQEIENKCNTVFYFATPYHSWERGSNENANGLIRQYLPKTESMEDLTQQQCDRIANALNSRPRKRFKYKTPEEMYYGI